MSLLHSLFDETFTHPEIAAAITSRLTHFRQHSHPHLPPNIGHEIRLATLAQDNIGWKNFLEGLASKKWGMAQQRYYNQQHITSISSRQWLNKLLARLLRMAHALWKHRNDILHNPFSQRNRAMIKLLHQEIIEEYTRGPEDLPPRDRGRFRFPLGEIILKSLTFKQAWVLNLTAARHAQARQRSEAADARASSRRNSRVVQWSNTGILY
jgi:hypothetical protein